MCFFLQLVLLLLPLLFDVIGFVLVDLYFIYLVAFCFLVVGAERATICSALSTTSTSCTRAAPVTTLWGEGRLSFIAYSVSRHGQKKKNILPVCLSRPSLSLSLVQQLCLLLPNFWCLCLLTHTFTLAAGKLV